MTLAVHCSSTCDPALVSFPDSSQRSGNEATQYRYHKEFDTKLTSFLTCMYLATSFHVNGGMFTADGLVSLD